MKSPTQVDPIDARNNSGSPRRPARRRPRRSLFSDLFHLLFFGVGLAFIGVALYKAADAWHLVRHGLPVTGTVTGFEVRTDKKARTTRLAQVSYRDRSGEPHVMVMSWQTTSSPRSVGEQVSLLHDPDEPGHARVDTFGELWGSGLFALGFGALFSGLTAARWRKTLPARRRRSR